MKNKQTAVEWLVEQLPIRILNAYQKEIEKTKAMEKQQIIEAVYYSMETNFDPNMDRAELYYNEKYGK